MDGPQKEPSESEHRLRLFVDHAPAAIAMVDREMRYLAVSRRWLEDYRLGDADVIGRCHYDVFPDIPERWKEVHRRCLAGAVERNDEEPFLRGDGKTDWVKWEIHPWRSASGEVGGLMLFTEVVTRRKEAELALQQREKLESIGRLAGGIAHDFNNLLTVILSCAHALAEDAAAGRAANARDVEEITAAGERAAELVRQLLTFARKQVATPVTIDLNTTVRNAERLLRRVVDANVRITERLADGLWRVRCDPVQMEMVVLNLALNARDAMPRGGTLRFETANVEPGAEAHPGVPALAKAPHVRLTVRDTGQGMTPEVQQRAFEPFYTTKPPGAGMGLGLPAVYGVVQQNGGAVVMDTGAGRGTAVHVYLPRYSGEEEATAPAGSPARSRGSEAVLVVEDDARVREITARALREAGYRVIAAPGAEEALEAVPPEAAPPDLLLTDVVMPGLDGRELAAQIRERHPGLRVLFVSGYADDVLGEAWVLDPAIELLPKPFTPESLLERVRAVLDRPARHG